MSEVNGDTGGDMSKTPEGPAPETPDPHLTEQGDTPATPPPPSSPSSEVGTANEAADPDAEEADDTPRDPPREPPKESVAKEKGAEEAGGKEADDERFFRPRADAGPDPVAPSGPYSVSKEAGREAIAAEIEASRGGYKTEGAPPEARQQWSSTPRPVRPPDDVGGGPKTVTDPVERQALIDETTRPRLDSGDEPLSGQPGEATGDGSAEGPTAGASDVGAAGGSTESGVDTDADAPGGNTETETDAAGPTEAGGAEGAGQDDDDALPGANGEGTASGDAANPAGDPADDAAASDGAGNNDEPPDNPGSPGDDPAEESDHGKELTPHQRDVQATNRRTEPRVDDGEEDEVHIVLPYGHVDAEVGDDSVHITDMDVPPDAQRDGAATRMLQELGEWAKAHGKHSITGDVVGTAALGPRVKAFGTDNMSFYRYVPGTVDEKQELPDMTYADAVAYLASVAAIPEDQRPEDFDETLGVRTNLDEWEPGS